MRPACHGGLLRACAALGCLRSRSRRRLMRVSNADVACAAQRPILLPSAAFLSVLRGGNSWEGQKSASSQPLNGKLGHTAQSHGKDVLGPDVGNLKCAEGQTRSERTNSKKIASETDTIKLVCSRIFSPCSKPIGCNANSNEGPLSTQSTAALLAAGHCRPRRSIHQYYLAINVLSNGHGASHRELLETTKVRCFA